MPVSQHAIIFVFLLVCSVRAVTWCLRCLTTGSHPPPTYEVVSCSGWSSNCAFTVC